MDADSSGHRGMSKTIESIVSEAARLDALLASVVERYPERAAEAEAIRAAIHELTEIQRQGHALVARGGSIEEMRKLAFDGTARAAAIIREYDRLHDPERYSAAN
jgi:hypothetical protein